MKPQQKKLLSEYYESQAKDFEGKPWYIRHKSSLLILGLTIVGMVACAVWSHYFPYGIW